ncbi:unnamed protein product [Linum trigynum]|uniref:Retrotransposon gag domain-containing protein n=1 Tax=Linum trigynum TaxID=586398 RepID=A0AAV2GAL5_9ROSI
MKEVVEPMALHGLSSKVEEKVELEDRVKDHGNHISQMQSNINQILSLIKEGMKDHDALDTSRAQRDKGKIKVVEVDDPEDEETEEERPEADLSFLEEHLQPSFRKESGKGKGPIILHNPLAKKLFRSPVPPNFSSLGLRAYNRSIDPNNHLSAFTLKMQLMDDDLCKAFPITFGGRCRTWYTSLPEGIIDNFEQFATLFTSKFATQICWRLMVTALINCTHGEGEAMVDFYDRWNTIAGSLRMATRN